MFDALPPELLAHILQMALGPYKEKYVGEGRHARGLPLLLGADSTLMCDLRLVCKSFRDMLLEVPVHVTATSAHQLRSLAASSFTIATVQLKLGAKAHSLMHAASALPDKERRKVVAVEMSSRNVCYYDVGQMQRQLECLCQLIIHRTGADSLASFDGFYRLSSIERLELSDSSVQDLKLLALLPILANLHSLRCGTDSSGETSWLPLHVLALCPAVRVLELGHRVSLTSLGTSEEALKDLEESRLDTLKLRCTRKLDARIVWEGQGETDLMGFWDLVESAQLNKQFSFAVEEDGWLVLRRRCAESSLKQEVAACTGPSLVLGGDLSRQLVISPDLQALVCQAGLPVELHFDLFARHLEGADWARLDVPERHRAVRVESVLSWHWHTEHESSWWFLLDTCQCRGVAAIHGLTIPSEEDGSGMHEFAARFCNLRALSIKGQGRLMEALPKSCQRVEMCWTGSDSMGLTAGLGTYASITRLCLQTFSVTELPPGVEHLELQYCDVEGLVLPAQRQLRSIRLRCCNPEHGGATFALQSGRAPIDLLAWLAAARPGAAVQVSDSQLALGRLSMERYAERLSEAAPHSVDIRACTLHGRDGRLSRRVADMARYMGRRFSRRVAVACPASKNSCRIERVYKGQ